MILRSLIVIISTANKTHYLRVNDSGTGLAPVRFFACFVGGILRCNADDSCALRLAICMMIPWLSSPKKLMKGDVK